MEMIDIIVLNMFYAIFGAVLALSLFTLIALAILIIPTVMLVSSLVDTVQQVSKGLEEGTLQVPPPPESDAGWPLVGEKLHVLWSAASTNLMETVERYAPQLNMASRWLLSTAACAGTSVLQFIIAILIAAALMANAQAEHVAAERGRRSLRGARGAGLGTAGGERSGEGLAGFLGPGDRHELG